MISPASIPNALLNSRTVMIEGGIGNTFEPILQELAKSEKLTTIKSSKENSGDNESTKTLSDLELLLYLDCFGRDKIVEFATIIGIEIGEVQKLVAILKKMNDNTTLNTSQRNIILENIYSQPGNRKRSEIMTVKFKKKYLEDLRKVLNIDRIAQSGK